MRNVHFRHGHEHFLLCLCLFTLLGSQDSCVLRAAITNDLIAHYRFQTNGDDCLVKSGSFHRGEADTISGFLYVDGTFFAPAPLNVGQRPIYRGTPSLHELDYRAFTIGLDFYPLARRDPKPKAMLNKLEKALDDLTRGFYRQRLARGDWGNRNILTGGRSYRWIGFNRDNNRLNLTLNNQRFTHQFKGSRVEPDCWHQVFCSVNLRERRILTWLDGKKLESITLPTDFKLEILGSPDEETDREFTFANFSNGSVFNGYAADLKIFSRALSESELAVESSEALAEMPTFPTKPFFWHWPVGILISGGLCVFFLMLWRARNKQFRNSAHS